MYCASKTNLLSAPGHVAQEQTGVHTSAAWTGSMLPHHTTSHCTALHYTTLHYTLQFSTVGTSEVRTLSRTQEKHSSKWSMERFNMAVIWTRPKPVQTSIAERDSSSPDTDRRIWVKFLAGRNISLFTLTPTGCGSSTLICTKANGECR